VVHFRGRSPALLVGWLWFLGMFVPMIGLIQAGSQSMADRYTYWPAIGIALAAVWLTSDAATARGMRDGIRAACAGVVLLTLAFLSARLATTWNSDLSLFGRAAALTSGNFIAELNYGAALARAGRTEEALAHYRRAISFNPRYADAYFNLAVNLDRLGRVPEAREAYLEALRCDPRHAASQHNLGQLFARQGRTDEALAYFREALENNPWLTQAHISLGLLLARLGRSAEAVDHFRAVVRLQPGNVAARAELQRLEAASAGPR
jgi:tetratricopeptide (TPR) repeat protein